ncbi:MAG: class I SAM-dependent methyltransferase [Solirubrobacteraceae bacterium]
MTALPRRLVFGEVADSYDRHRPTYPQPLIDDLIGLAAVGAGDRVLEVGAGTGKATALFAARGLRVLAIEPSPSMAALARRNCAENPGVEVVETDFERWDPAGETFALIYSAQAWHWIEPDVGYRRAREALASGGVLGAFWNRPAWGRSELRNALIAAYEVTVPDLKPDGPLHPANEAPEGDDGWPAQIDRADGLHAPELRRYPWSISYTGDQYVGLLSTLSEVRLLQPARRRALLSAVRAAIETHGGTLQMPMVTRLWLARAV